MDKCRICLKKNKKLVSIIEKYKNIRYMDMITAVANVKIENDVIYRICFKCQKSLIDSYYFKILIEKSNTILNHGNIKKINFWNITDIKNELCFTENKNIFIPKVENIVQQLENGFNEIYYCNTVIQRVYNCQIPILNHLQIVSQVTEDDLYNKECENDDDFISNDDDTEYVPESKSRKINYKTKQSEISNKNSSQLNKIKSIRPVYLENYKLVPNKAPKKSKTDKKRVYNARVRVCPYCGKLTKSLESHILLHTGERKFCCSLCDKKFFKENYLKNHLKQHSGTKEFKCDQCVAAFNDKGVLKRHMLSHTEERKFICEFCSKAFKRKSGLKRHSITHNSANKTVMCELCNMSFFCKYGLNHHMRVHTGDRPYKCEICSQPYSYKHDFNRHCFKKHGVFLKRRSINVMNEEVLKREKTLMKELMFRQHYGVTKDRQPLNPFEGPQAAMAFEQTVKAIQTKEITLDS